MLLRRHKARQVVKPQPDEKNVEVKTEEQKAPVRKSTRK